MNSTDNHNSPGQPMQVRVDCYAGYRGEETPRRFWLGENKIEVQAILDRWMAPDHRYFKILGDDRAVYILRHDSATWNWQLTFFKQADSRDNGGDLHAGPHEKIG